MSVCDTCPTQATLEKMGLKVAGFDRVVALAGNPNTGKSTLFNALTGLRQHTGNWPGKTVARAEGGYTFAGVRYKLVDLPGAYSLLSASQDEEIARDFILFGRPDCTVVVVDATCLERHLNLVLQVLEISDRVVVCLNLMDEARRKGLRLNAARLGRDLGVPVVPTVASTGEGVAALIQAVAAMAAGRTPTRPRRLTGAGAVQHAVAALVPQLNALAPGLPNSRWVALRLLDGDWRVRQALRRGELTALAAQPMSISPSAGRRPASAAEPQALPAAEALLQQADAARQQLGRQFHDQVVVGLYQEAERLARRVVTTTDAPQRDWAAAFDRLATSPWVGLPLILGLLAVVFWLTVTGANVPSALLARALFWLEDQGSALFAAWGAPVWLTGLVWHGVYRTLAWVVSVMLPPMAIFFPCFTILEDAGYLPRVAFNLDGLFRRAGAHGKQALTMSMGLGCNAAGVIATRIIDSPRERLIAILTNNFVPCNGRFPTLVMLATLFVAASFPPAVASVAAAGAVLMVVVVGVIVTLLVSAGLSRTMLRGEASAFTLELPPYRRPAIGRILYTSLIDRTLFVLGRAVATAVPAGALIWLLGNVVVGSQSLAAHAAAWLNPLGVALGLDGVIVLAYIIAIPANEIVIPTMLMIYLGTGMMTDVAGLTGLRQVLIDGQGWTLLTAVNLMLFSLLHNPCATTLWTMWQETHSWKWTALGAALPLGIACLVCATVAAAAHLVG